MSSAFYKLKMWRICLRWHHLLHYADAAHSDFVDNTTRWCRSKPNLILNMHVYTWPSWNDLTLNWVKCEATLWSFDQKLHYGVMFYVSPCFVWASCKTHISISKAATVTFIICKDIQLNIKKEGLTSEKYWHFWLKIEQANYNSFLSIDWLIIYVSSIWCYFINWHFGWITTTRINF